MKSRDMCTKPHQHATAYFHQEILSNRRLLDLDCNKTPASDFGPYNAARIDVSFPSFAIYNKVPETFILKHSILNLNGPLDVYVFVSHDCQ